MGGAQAAAAPEAPEAPEAPPKKKAKAAPERGTGLGSRRALTSLDAWEREPLKHAWSLHFCSIKFFRARRTPGVLHT